MSRARRLLACALAGLVVQAARAQPPAEVMARLSHAVLKVSALGDNDRYAVGSAVVIAPDEVLTNCHVTRHAHTIVLSRGLTRYEVVRQRADVSRDLCLLTPARALPMAPVALRPTTTLRPGENVVAHGYSGGMEARFARGRVVDLHAASGSHIVQTSAGFLQGASGGGLFDDEGRLVGITTFLTAAGQVEYFAMPADWIARVRARVPQPVGPLRGIALWEQLPAHQPHFMRLLEPLARDDRVQAGQLADEWTQEEPHAPAAWLMRARTRRALGQSEPAGQALDKAIELARDDAIELARVEAYTRREGLEQAHAAAVAALLRHRPIPLPVEP